MVNLQGFSRELTLTSRSLEKLLGDKRIPADVQHSAKELLTGELQESISFIQNAVKHLGNIIDGLLRLSRIGRVEYSSAPIDLNQLVSDILASLHSQIVKSGAQVHVHPLPVVAGDRNAVGQIFANIVGNALKSFAPDPNSPQASSKFPPHDDATPIFRFETTASGFRASTTRKYSVCSSRSTRRAPAAKAWVLRS